MKRALSLGGEYARLVIDAARFLGTWGTPADVDAVIEATVREKPSYLENGRIALLYIQNLVKQSRLDEAEKLLLRIPEVADMREGELSVTAVWIDLYRAKTAAADGRAPADIPADEILRALGKAPGAAEESSGAETSPEAPDDPDGLEEGDLDD